MEYWAHSENCNKKKHCLSKHLRETAILAKTFTSNDQYKRIFYITGLLHDLGKYQREFQDYLENGGRRGSVPHASWGAGYARLLGILEASISIDGHHKGLPDNSAWKSDTEPYNRGEIQYFDEIKQIFIREMDFDETQIEKINLKEFQRELFIRYLFSALTDSDWLSTEKHFDMDKSEMRPVMDLPIDEMIINLQTEILKKSTEGEINRLRNKALNEVISNALLPIGFFSLALPTGMGKTLASLSWALHHARMNELKRIIIVLPFINIIDQTAQTLKDIFGEELVLEHHSSYNESVDEDESLSLQHKKKQLASENWNYPVIVTTTVQFFESLFSNKISRCRKVHNIAEAVVIFDEVQTLPKEIILPTLQMLKDVQAVMKSSFLFCTATQPAFEKRQCFDGIEGIIPLIGNSEEIYMKTKRVEYSLINDLNPVDNNILLKCVVRENKSSLIIFNTKKSALEFYICAGTIDTWEKRYYMSTSMCPSHRKEVIKNIRADLRDKKKILVVSTQLIEAGVDFDFPVVFRAIAPLESIIQSAGRCNREGRLGESGGKVYIFKLEDGGMPDKTYSACAGYAEEFIRSGIERLHDHDIYKEYYSDIIHLFADPDKFKINDSRKQFNFKTVNDSYRLIDDPTQGLYIYHYNEESRNLFHSIEYKEFLSRADYRKMQAYTVQVYKHFIIKNGEMCKMMPQGFMVWYGNYDKDTGLSTVPIDSDKMIL
jgi:CRISPR-associated endonuclease/helicase Cas3